MTKNEILELVQNTENSLIKAGENHRFNYIWIVIAEERLFCRQYDFSERSWYSTFQKSSNGYIKCGDTILKVRGVIPKDLDKLNNKINLAYIDKYANKFKTYPKIAHQMTESRFMAKTMELIPIID